MGRRHRTTTKSHTLPSSPTHSFTSSSSFEFTVSHKSSAAASADDLFYNGQLLPLRLSTVRSSTSSDTTSRDSTASLSSSSYDLLPHHLDCDSSRPSSAADEDTKRLSKPSKYFSLSKFSSVFRKENGGTTAVKRAREVLRKYLKKVKPLYEKLSQKLPSTPAAPPTAAPPPPNRQIKQSFSGNLRYPRRRSHVSSCPSSMMSSPRHGESGFRYTQVGRVGSGSWSYNPNASSMEELQNAIQGAIAHCKNSMMMKKVSHEEKYYVE